MYLECRRTGNNSLGAETLSGLRVDMQKGHKRDREFSAFLSPPAGLVPAAAARLVLNLQEGEEKGKKIPL